MANYVWNWADGGTITGLNYNTSQHAYNPNLCVYNNNLYYTWHEYNQSSIRQIRVKQWNGSSWDFIDGNGTNGINYNTSQNALYPNLCVYNNNLYCTWQEYTSSSIWQIRVKKYDGTSWIFIDGGSTNGINYNTSQTINYPTLCAYNNELYCTWYEYNGSNYQIRVKKYNGITWTWIDGGSTNGINYNTSQNAMYPNLCVYNNNLYCIWQEYNSSSIYQIRIKQWNGTSWTFVDGNGTDGMNYNITKSAHNPNLCTYNGNLYCTWYESNSSSYNQIRVKKYDGTSWIFIDSGSTNGLNYNTSYAAYNPILYVFNNNLYCAWYEGATGQIRIKQWNGSTWTFIDGNLTNGLNYNTNKSAMNPNLCVYNNRLYCSWYESNSNTFYQIRAKNMIAQTPPIFTGNVSLSNVHNSDIQLSGNITSDTDTIQYKISVNGVQVYPSSGYTTLSSSPVNANYTIPNNLLNQLTNVITIDCNSSSNLTCTNSYNVSIYNNTPMGNMVISNSSIHSEDVIITGTLSDPDSDQISYNILLNDNEIQTWSTFANNPTINYTIANDLLTIGDNIITIKYKDNFKNSLMSTFTQVVTKINNVANINVNYINGSLIGLIGDPDSDQVQYKIYINGLQVYPEFDYTSFAQTQNINYQINRSDILIGQNNMATIYAQDSFNSEVSQNITFIGEYIGLMFMDENQQFYTTDIGELLRYLDFGTITLGQITEPVKILVQNKFGFPIKDINLTVDNGLENITIELCKENNPFIANNNLILENSYDPNEIDYFYIRLNTCISQTSSIGTFKIKAFATPII